MCIDAFTMKNKQNDELKCFYIYLKLYLISEKKGENENLAQLSERIKTIKTEK